MIERRAARVRVPCSTSNLGSGFDVLGLALNRYLEADFQPGDNGLRVRRTGTLADLEAGGPEPNGSDSTRAEDLLLWAFADVMAAAGADLDGELALRSEIPVARGLGSSAAALVAGHDLARAVLELDVSRVETFHAAARREGHGDNAAPCVFGGLQAVVRSPSGFRALPLELSPAVGFAYAAPVARVSTSVARAALPRTVAHGVAVGGLGRLVALTRGLAEGDAELIRVGFEDELHVPYRLPLIPAAADAMDAGRLAGAWAVTISGSGSGLIAACPPEAADVVAGAMREVFAAEADGSDCVGFALRPDLEGARRL
jgi:homoserine kinase